MAILILNGSKALFGNICSKWLTSLTVLNRSNTNDTGLKEATDHPLVAKGELVVGDLSHHENAIQTFTKTVNSGEGLVCNSSCVRLQSNDYCPFKGISHSLRMC